MSRGASMGRSFGLEIDEISIDQAKDKYPLLDTKHAKAAWFLPQDGQINPVDITMCLAKEAKRMGASIIEKNRVMAIDQVGDKVTKVVTELGDITCDKIVISAGMWSREVG